MVIACSAAQAGDGTPTNGGTFSFIAQVADNASATAQQIFTVTIQNHAPVINVQGWTNGVIRLLISGDGGADYSIESSTNLLDWETRLTTNSPALPFSWTDTNPVSPAPAGRRFYRAWLGQ